MAKEYLTPTEEDIALYRRNLNPFADALIGSGLEYGGALRDLYKSNIEGDSRFDRDWELEDAMPLATDALTLGGIRPVVSGIKMLGGPARSLYNAGSTAAKSGANVASRGATRAYNAATGAKRSAPQFSNKSKVGLNNPSGKNEIIPYEPKVGLLSRAGQAIKNNPKKSLAAGAAGLYGASQLLGDDEPATTETEQAANKQASDAAAQQGMQQEVAPRTLNNPTGTQAGGFEGPLNAASVMPDYLARPGSNTKMPNRQKQALITEADRRLRNEISARKKQDKAAASRAHVDEVLKANNDRYRNLYANSSDDRSGEDWDAMSRDEKVQLIKNYNINMGRKSMEKPDGSKPAAVRPDGSPVSQKNYDKFFNNPDVPDLGNMADRTRESMVPVYGPEGVVGYNSRSETARAAKEYAKNSMRNNPRSTTANVFSGDMQSLYPTLPVNRFKNEVDYDEAEEQKKYNPFV